MFICVIPKKKLVVGLLEDWPPCWCVDGQSGFAGCDQVPDFMMSSSKPGTVTEDTDAAFDQGRFIHF